MDILGAGPSLDHCPPFRIYLLHRELDMHCDAQTIGSHYKMVLLRAIIVSLSMPPFVSET